jgi:hypothetical protein
MCVILLTKSEIVTVTDLATLCSSVLLLPRPAGQRTICLNTGKATYRGYTALRNTKLYVELL